MINKIHVSTTNSKLSAAIPSINLPAGRTCRPDAPCFKKCYAKKGNWRFRNVQKSLSDNLEEYLRDPAFYFHFIAVTTKFSRYVRWHSSGDIVDARYLVGMCDVARENPEVNYLCFTKKFDLVNAYIDGGNAIPENLHIVFSGWDKAFEVDNPHNFPVTYVRLKNEDNGHIPEDAIPCGGKCYECIACWQLQKGQTVYFEEH